MIRFCYMGHKYIKSRKFWKTILVLTALIYFGSQLLSERVLALYKEQASDIVQDRNGNEILIQPNKKGQYVRFAESVPSDFKNLLIAKEDRFFFYHPGINPISIFRSLIKYPFNRRFEGSSTLTQQLVKTLLGNENKRTANNKLIEALYAVSLELHTNKQEILLMYANAAYFGNGAQGIVEAGKLYFNLSPESLNKEQLSELLATLNNPSKNNGTKKNTGDEYAYQRKDIGMFELSSFEKSCAKPCSFTIDKSLTNTVREILRTNLDSPAYASVNNGAVVVIRFDKNNHENELLAIVGSPHPNSLLNGNQINMAVRPRAIGSTFKPFIYAKAFESGARPYTKVDDIEYKYDIGTGFAFYPKNYDGKYRGTVTLHEALSNSLNVPAVRVLQFVGLNPFYDFLKKELRFKPLQPLETYELSIALGGLEMDLLTLSNYFTFLPNEGILKPLKLTENDTIALPMAEPFEEHKIIDPAYAELVTKILSDRETSVDQFGLKSNLNLPATNYAVKTGTSYDYHDSWTIGYTPDFLVGVWLGNNNNKPMQQLSGSVGAGKVWHEVMEIMLNSPYNKEASFNFDKIKEYTNSGSIQYGLPGDNYEFISGLLKNNGLILQPHNNETLEYTKGMKVPLRGNETLSWYINGLSVGTGSELSWEVAGPGTYTVSAKTQRGKTEKITLDVKKAE